MIKNNTIYFGYGSVVVQSLYLGLRFISVEDQICDIGKKIGVDDIIKNPRHCIDIVADLDTFFKLCKDIRTVTINPTIKEVKIHDYTLNFERYNVKSIQLLTVKITDVINQADKLIYLWEEINNGSLKKY